MHGTGTRPCLRIYKKVTRSNEGCLVRVLEKEFNRQTYRLSYHADLRHTMRIDAGKRVSAEVLEEAVPYTLSVGINAVS